MNRDGEPIVSIQLILRNRPVRFRAVIDTGFNGYLCAPRRLLSRGIIPGTPYGILELE